MTGYARVNCHFATKVVLDLARLDRIGAMLVDDLSELCLC